MILALSNYILYIIDLLIIGLVIFILVFLYKRLLGNWKKQTPDPNEFVTLYSLESPIAVGVVDFFFEHKQKRHIRLAIENAQNQELIVLLDEERKSGGHVIPFDTSQLENGSYYYVLKTANQSTAKLMRVKNEK